MTRSGTRRLSNANRERGEGPSDDALADELERLNPSRSGTPTTPNAKRKRPLVHLSLSPEASARLDEVATARGTTRSGAVEQLIRNARLGGK